MSIKLTEEFKDRILSGNEVVTKVFAKDNGVYYANFDSIEVVMDGNIIGINFYYGTLKIGTMLIEGIGNTLHIGGIEGRSRVLWSCM